MGTIVVCEDDPTIQKLIRVALRSTSHTLHVASDGADGLALVKQVHPDLVLSDVAMPALDGFGLLDALKADPELARIPVVFVTASTQRHTVEASLVRGAAGFLVKPFSAADLRATIEQHLGGEVSPAEKET